MRCAVPRVFELHGDEVGRGGAVAGLDCDKGLVQRLCRWQIADRRQKSLRGPTSCDLLGQNAQAVAGLLRIGSAGERYRA
jgi:hypothetical protein